MLTAIALASLLQAAPPLLASPATAVEAPRDPEASAFEQAFDQLSGFGPEGFDACLPSGNADAHLSNLNEQLRMVHQLLEAEARQGVLTPRVAAIRELLSDDKELKLARYFVQTISEESCEP